MSKIINYGSIVPNVIMSFLETENYKILLHNLDLFSGMDTNELLSSLDKIIDEYSKYIDSININMHFEIIIYLLGNIGFYGGNSETILNDIVDYIYTKYLKLIIDYIEKITYSNNEEESIYLKIVYKIINIIYDTIFILYSYRYYIHVIPQILSIYGVNTIMPQNISTDIYITMQNFFTYLEHNITGGNFITIDYTNISTKETIYRYIINNFNKEFLNDNTIFLNFMSIDTIISKFDVVTEMYNRYLNGTEVMDNTKIIIINIIMKLHHYYHSEKNYISTKSNMYITLPQYEENCWYLAILTCMTFSDASKDLLIKKIKLMYQNNNSQPIILSDADKELFNIILMIIENITYNFATYNVNKQYDCDKLVYFKEGLMIYIYKKYNEFINLKRIKDKSIAEYILNEKIGCDEYLYYHMAQIYENHEIDSTTYIIPSGMIVSGYSIINTFYKIFNIKTLWIYNYNNIEYRYQKQNNDINPDIIFIQLYDDILLYNHLKINSNLSAIFNIEQIRYNKNYIITYNGSNYKLDYTIYHSDDDISNKYTGHVISSIHYDGNQYFHDSDTVVQKIDCSDKEITIPCPLVKYNWKDNIYFKNEFCIKKCFHNKVSTSSKIQNLKAQIHVENFLCFNNAKNIVLAYVKI